MNYCLQNIQHSKCSLGRTNCVLLTLILELIDLSYVIIFRYFNILTKYEQNLSCNIYYLQIYNTHISLKKI